MESEQKCRGWSPQKPSSDRNNHGELFTHLTSLSLRYGGASGGRANDDELALDELGRGVIKVLCGLLLAEDAGRL